MAESKQHVYEVDKSTVLSNQSKVYLMSKRIMDINLALIGVILLIPLFIVIAVLIKIEDKKGPIMFKQVRVGVEGKTFYMYKFRSMVSNAEDLLEDLLIHNEASGPLFKMKKDPRITKIGGFLRKTSLDELPQLFNVLLGDMSLVGPRPALPKEVEAYSLHERKRLNVLPGLTCYWQVQGRSNLTFQEQVELDIKYICTRNLLIDIKLIMKTFIVLFGSKDAY
ncbi:sugar transferase [Terribacillus saccharophilus]|uniref:Multidrug MFS transporter n=1 Tax=Terribacillus saccharophilus TaxID=361277 RepID=A0ABX4GXQ7_9BACI|nr:sugar transferase [Terribacillus saccharophilus]PAD35270.1 multidrug MFS transporter [Terribacillus saccharophilus]PAD96019.1 multidrug MFS transporter [Terribacillus saccharophilus]PAD99657.1 multidrug MFS transporter [Terribacillus saccharophilus]